MKLMGYFHGIDPAACLLIDGKVVAYVEEERLLRYKHAANLFPIRAMDACLKKAGLSVQDLDAFVYGWNAPRYQNSGMQAFYDELNEKYPPDEGTRAWQKRNIGLFTPKTLEGTLQREIVRFFGVPPNECPPLRYFPHHHSHAAAAFYASPHEEALVLTLDGSGDSECTTLWHGKGAELSLLHRVEIPHSLGWLYAAITEYLGFDAYDGEYKVMGLAAYGRENLALREALAQVVHPGPQGFDYEVEPRFIHHGPHSYSGRFTDHLVELLGLPPRQGKAPLERVHKDLAYEVQWALEEHVLRLVTHFQKQTGLKNLCIGGGVGLNVKMNSRLHREGLFDSVWAFPVPSDSACGLGAALGLEASESKRRPPPIDDVYWGPAYSDEEIEAQIRSCGLAYARPESIAEATAELLQAGKVVAWVQGGLEGGPRALGGRSILADPRSVEARDRVNAAIKFREYWRPFCPSLTEEDAPRFMKKSGPAPYMILAFEATDEAKEKVPAVVHVDGTMRVQTVRRETNPRYYDLLKAFEQKTGVPVVLNTSLNIKGEAMVCSPRDALRTFFSTGIDALAMGAFLIEKPKTPVALPPEEVIR